jgi:acetyl-CoA acetyltransferase family protein
MNRFCSSGLVAIQTIANQIKVGEINIGIAVGAENMSTNPDNGALENPGEKIASQPKSQDASKPMGWTSENVAGDFAITREAQDEFAASSFQKAEKAQAAGWFADEIVPIKTSWKDPKTGEGREIIVSSDDGIRPGTTSQGLSKIRAAFPQWSPSTTTGGNASQITDGAAAVLLMKRSTAEKLKQPVVGKFVAASVAGLEPRIMGIGPQYSYSQAT